MTRLLLLFLVSAISFSSFSQVKVGLMNGDVKYHQDLKVKTFFTKPKIVTDDGMEYMMSEVYFYEDKKGYFRVEHNRSGTYDILQRTSTGVIETYYVIKNQSYYNGGMYGGTGGWTSSSKRIDYYAFQGEPVQTMNYNNLVNDIGMEPICMDLLRQGKSAKTIGTVATVAGIGLVVGSFINQASQEDDPGASFKIPVGAWVGLALSQASWITGSITRNKNQQAIGAYNHLYE